MSGGYAAVFVIAVIFVFVAIANAAIGNYIIAASGLIYWGYTAWKMYYRDNESLVAFHRVLIFIQGFFYLTMIAVIGFSDDNSIVQTREAIFGILAIGGGSMLIGYGLIFLFKRQISNQSDIRISIPNGEYGIDDRYWEAAAYEFSSNRNEAVWARLFSLSDGDEAKAKARYLKSRASDLMREAVSGPMQTLTVGRSSGVNSHLDIGRSRNSFRPFGMIAPVLFLSYIAYIIFTDDNSTVFTKPKSTPLIYPSSASELMRRIEERTLEAKDLRSKVINSNLDVFGNNYNSSGLAMSPELVLKVENNNLWWFGSDMRFFVRLHNPGKSKLTGFNFLFSRSGCGDNGQGRVLINFDLMDSPLAPYSYGLYSSVLPTGTANELKGSGNVCGTIKFVLVEK